MICDEDFHAWGTARVQFRVSRSSANHHQGNPSNLAQRKNKRGSKRGSKLRSKARKREHLCKLEGIVGGPPANVVKSKHKNEYRFHELHDEEENVVGQPLWYDDSDSEDDHYFGPAVPSHEDQIRLLLEGYISMTTLCYETMMKCLDLCRKNRARPVDDDRASKKELLSNVVSLPAELQRRVMSYRYHAVVKVERAPDGVVYTPGIYLKHGLIDTCGGPHSFVHAFILYPDLTRGKYVRHWIFSGNLLAERLATEQRVRDIVHRIRTTGQNEEWDDEWERAETRSIEWYHNHSSHIQIRSNTADNDYESFAIRRVHGGLILDGSHQFSVPAIELQTNHNDDSCHIGTYYLAIPFSCITAAVISDDLNASASKEEDANEMLASLFSMESSSPLAPLENPWFSNSVRPWASQEQ